MASRLRLIHLTAVGLNLPPATIEFGDRLTVIHGASDTGKSHVLALIGYIFGTAQTIEVPDEGKGYQYIHLGLQIGDGDRFTLIRDLTGGPVGLAAGDVRGLLNAPAPEYLAPRHVSTDPRSVSRFLLDLAGLDGAMVRKNQNNETRALQWRDILRLVAVDEESILAKRSPIEFGQFHDRSVEAAIFRLFIEGHDDSGLTPIPKAAELKRISANKLEVLDQVIEELETELADVAPIGELRDRLARLNKSVIAASQALNEVSSNRDELVLLRSSYNEALASFREREDELGSLEARFGLLRAQYDSDLSRLDMLAGATDILTVDEGGSCPFCGAEPVHQHWPESPADPAEAETFTAAISSEQAKILALRSDLDQTIGAIQVERQEIQNQVDSIRADNTQLTADIRRLDADIRTPGGDLAPLLETRSRVERQLDAHTRLLNLLALRGVTAQIEKPKTSTEVPIASGDLHQFDTVAEEILRQWSFPSDSSVHYSTSERDLVVDQRVRRSRGKGVRSILHALFNVALADYCIRRGYRHPGFVILDSPIVTYRQPEEPELRGEEETVNISVVDAFYVYLQNHFHGQSLILENKSPVSPLPIGSREYFFGGTAETAARAGFYPPPLQ